MISCSNTALQIACLILLCFGYHKGHILLYFLDYIDEFILKGSDKAIIKRFLSYLKKEFVVKDLRLLKDTLMVSYLNKEFVGSFFGSQGLLYHSWFVPQSS